MSEQETKPDLPDFSQGISIADLGEGGMVLGQVAGEAVVLARNGAPTSGRCIICAPSRTEGR